MYKIPSLALKLTYHPVQWVQRHISLAVKVLGYEARYPPPSSTVTEWVELYFYSYIRLQGVHRDKYLPPRFPSLYLHIYLIVFPDHYLMPVRFRVFDKLCFGDKRCCAHGHAVFCVDFVLHI